MYKRHTCAKDRPILLWYCICKAEVSIKIKCPQLKRKLMIVQSLWSPDHYPFTILSFTYFLYSPLPISPQKSPSKQLYSIPLLSAFILMHTQVNCLDDVHWDKQSLIAQSQNRHCQNTTAFVLSFDKEEKKSYQQVSPMSPLQTSHFVDYLMVCPG